MNLIYFWAVAIRSRYQAFAISGSLVPHRRILLRTQFSQPYAAPRTTKALLAKILTIKFFRVYGLGFWFRVKKRFMV